MLQEDLDELADSLFFEGFGPKFNTFPIPSSLTHVPKVQVLSTPLIVLGSRNPYNGKYGHNLWMLLDTFSRSFNLTYANVPSPVKLRCKYTNEIVILKAHLQEDDFFELPNVQISFDFNDLVDLDLPLGVTVFHSFSSEDMAAKALNHHFRSFYPVEGSNKFVYASPAARNFILKNDDLSEFMVEIINDEGPDKQGLRRRSKRSGRKS